MNEKKYRSVLLGIVVVLLCMTLDTAFGLNIENALSPRNRERKKRPHTLYIVLHTTEAEQKGSLNKLRANGEAHYMVGTGGKIFRIIDKHRVAYHAGLSMWKGHIKLDNYSIGIEVVGYHNKDLTRAQYSSLKALLDELQRIYKIKDRDVITHSMVAYGKPNKWHKKAHRGRKRCGMLFAKDDVRKRIGLTEKTRCDYDVKAGRLKIGDPLLAEVLYGQTSKHGLVIGSNAASGKRGVVKKTNTPWDIAGPAYNASTTRYIFPDGQEKKGSTIRDWSTIPVGTEVILASGAKTRKTRKKASALTLNNKSTGTLGVQIVGEHGGSAESIAGSALCSKETIYFLPDGRVRCGDELTQTQLKKLPKKTAMLVGYTYGGYISNKKSAYDICAERWNDEHTFYRFSDGRIVSGRQITERNLPRNTLVFFRN